ncbi:sugar ABC transporter ATP-binding protein [Runella sp. SP2]|uniref:sugar ABC transporter ATP-binding protein n=1 Tax=Runella sp. SP2 TaxID=2268026 RepID=UPI000F089F25|nr:sugar ABC transporter ATP-binding protein [Runella sp. SP2]AYQ33028.1 sugar ABC transporter ATP-binding protein [Runella sp. SP2]
MTRQPDQLLQVRNLSKSFVGVKALDQVQLDLKKGEVHAVMGENGAGKSTFMKLLMGLLSPDSGEIWLEGEMLKNADVNETLKRGISMIHQEMLVVPELTVAQNIFLGREKTNWLPFWLDDTHTNAQAEAILQQMGVDIAPTTLLKHLSVAEMQMVEIAKAISNNAKVIIMDEPTSAISDKEVATLFKIIKDLKQQGVGILYISHKMDEIFQISDTITVLRDGQYIGTKPASELDQPTLISMMVGREITNLFPEIVPSKGEVVLSVKQLTRQGVFADITFEVRKGEVLGLAGLMGAGRTEVARAIFGLDRYDSGEIYLNGRAVHIHSPAKAIALGIGYVSEDRKGLGFIPAMTIQDNITLSSLPQHAKAGWVMTDSEATVASRMMQNLRIKATGAAQKVSHLSGGNQQKVVIAKVLQAAPNVVILDEPTRGIDIGAKFEIYKLINDLTAQGIAVVMISSELPEILGLSHRILVLSKGKQTALLSNTEATQDMIMKFAMQ